ncbi:MAG: glycosyltransferase family 39 protein [Pseudomonadales bacterium]|nr:glycosyltransferase family 39 protein [Pseudomonadales bacterium]
MNANDNDCQPPLYYDALPYDGNRISSIACTLYNSAKLTNQLCLQESNINISPASTRLNATGLNERQLFRLLVLLSFVLFIAKLFFAFKLDLYSDEIFYWQASTRSALAYTDLPFITALLAGIGSMLGGNHALAVRSVFILLGTAMPALVYWMARPVITAREALIAAILSLCIPLGGFLGLLAVPDVPLIFLGMLFIGCFERASRTGRPFLWVLCGAIAALGLNTHYRFILYPLAALIFLCLCSSQRRHLFRPELWVAVLLMGMGLLPLLSFNLNTDLSGLEYHFQDRHPWQFQAEGLLHLFKQAGLVTPPLYALFLFAIFISLRDALAGNDRKALFLCFALTHLMIFLLAAPWADNTRTSIHWPLAGYFPLLVLLPQALIMTSQFLHKKCNPVLARRLLCVIPALGFAGSLIAISGIGSQAFHRQLYPILGEEILSTKMAGWKEFNQQLSEILSQPSLAEDSVIITDNYYTAAQIEFSGYKPGTVWTLDNDKAVRDGRKTQYQLWEMDESALHQVAEQWALLITEDSTLSLDDKTLFMNRACTHFQSLELMGQREILSGEKSYSFYIGQIASTPANLAGPCPLPSHAWLDSPVKGSIVSGTIQISGWIFNNGGGIKTSKILLDGVAVAEINRTIARPDVITIMSAEQDPAQPFVGFEYSLDTTDFVNGWHTLSVFTEAASGEKQFFRETRVLISNP